MIGTYRQTGGAITGFLWTREDGFLDLCTHLFNVGLGLPYAEILPTAISNDGRYIFANARQPGATPEQRTIRNRGRRGGLGRRRPSEQLGEGGRRH